jgi:hypothetical protein
MYEQDGLMREAGASVVYLAVLIGEWARDANAGRPPRGEEPLGIASAASWVVLGVVSRRSTKGRPRARAKAAELRAQCDLLRDIFGNPFRPSPPLPPAVTAWNDGTVRGIAEGIYEDRQLPAGTLDTARLAILADALLDAGCDDEALIAHCRSEGPHARGCWAVDWILSKA